MKSKSNTNICSQLKPILFLGLEFILTYIIVSIILAIIPLSVFGTLIITILVIANPIKRYLIVANNPCQYEKSVL